VISVKEFRILAVVPDGGLRRGMTVLYALGESIVCVAFAHKVRTDYSIFSDHQHVGRSIPETGTAPSVWRLLTVDGKCPAFSVLFPSSAAFTFGLVSPNKHRRINPNQI